MNTRAETSTLKFLRRVFSRLRLRRRAVAIPEVDYHGEGCGGEGYGGRGAWGLAESPSEVTYEGPTKLIIPGIALRSILKAPSLDLRGTMPDRPKTKAVQWKDQQK